MNIWWIRRDIRLGDNPTLSAALLNGPVLPLFILDPHLLERTPPNRQRFLMGGLAELDYELKKRGSSLLIRTGPPLEALRALLAETNAQTIYAEEDFTPYAHARDEKIAQSLPLTLIHGQTVHHPALIHKADGKPYTVFTPFSKAWKALLPSNLAPLPAPAHFPPITLPPSVLLSAHPFPSADPSADPSVHPFIRSNPLTTPSADPSVHPFPSVDNPIRSSAHHPLTTPSPNNFPPGETEALRRLAQFANFPITNYAETRNRLDLDGTSALSPYLRFGMISLRQAAHAALLPSPPGRGAGGEGASTWLNELIWREFYISILYHFPRVAKTSFNPALANIPWRNDPAEFEAWKHGQTGVPVVDAAMRQLLATGWMHNRARMIVASFLVKDLLINWQWGERWFMDNLLDGDPAANNGGWQWTAGTGTDAAPYFRIFNPILQSAKFDPEGDYIRRWVPELAHLSTPDIHAPWEKKIRIPGYPPKPIVDREKVKERTLAAYQKAKTTWENRK